MIDQDLALSARHALGLAQQGINELSPAAYETLSLTGAYLASIPPSVEDLPPPFVIARDAQNPTLRKQLSDREAWQGILPHVDRLAGQGLDPLQISQRLAIDLNVFREAYCLLPEVRLAMDGAARAIDQASATLTRNARNGETAAARFFLQTRAGFNRPKDQAPVAVSIQGDAVINLSSTEALRQRQAKILEEVNYDELA